MAESAAIEGQLPVDIHKAATAEVADIVHHSRQAQGQLRVAVDRMVPLELWDLVVGVAGGMYHWASAWRVVRCTIPVSI